MKKHTLSAAAFRARKARGAAPAVKPQDSFEAFYTRWRNGEQLAALAQQAGIKRSKFRRMLIAKAGGKAQFAVQRTAGAGGAGRGANLRKGVARPRVNDAGLKYLKRGPDWSARRVWIPKLVEIKTEDGKAKVLWRECIAIIFVSPRGNEYVRAEAAERADALLRGQHGLPDTRLRKYEDSKLASRVSTHVARAERIAESADRIAARDTERRTARRRARKAGARER